MIDHRTIALTGRTIAMSGQTIATSHLKLPTQEALADEARQQMQAYINDYLQEHHIISITESWNPHGTLAITVWFAILPEAAPAR